MDKLLQRFCLSTPKTMFNASTTKGTRNTERPSIQSIVHGFRGPRPNMVAAVQDVECPPVEGPGVSAATAVVASEKEPDVCDLTAILNEEAEKVRKWKVEAEFELQLLNNKLGNSIATINDLRKANSDLQQKCEEQNAQIEEFDLVTREDIMRKIESNWDTCCKIQKQVSCLSDGVLKLRNEGKEVTQWERNKVHIVHDLNNKYDNLKKTHIELTDLLKGNVAELEQENYDMQKRFEDTIADFNNMIEDLTDQFEAELEKGMFLKDELKSAQNEISSIKSDIANCNNQISSKDAAIVELQEGKKHLESRFQKLERRNSNLSDMLSKKEKKIGKLERENYELSNLMLTVHELQVENDKLNVDFGKLQEENRTLSCANACVKNDLENERNQLGIEKNECKKLKNKLEEQMTVMNNSKLTISTLEKDAEISEKNRNLFLEDIFRKEQLLVEISEQKLKLEAELAQNEQLLELARGEKLDILGKMKEDNSEYIRIRSELEEKVVELENQLKDCNNLVEKLHIDMDKVQVEMQNQGEELEKMKSNAVLEKEKEEKAMFEMCELKAQLLEMEKNQATAVNYDLQIAEMMNTLENYKVDNEKIVTQKQKEIEDLKEIVELGVKRHSELINTHQEEIAAIMQQLKAANEDLEIAVKEKNENASKLEESEKDIIELKKIQQCQEIEIAELKGLNQSQGTSSCAKKSILKRTVGKAVTFIKTPSPITSDNSNSDGVEIAPNVVDQLFNKSTLTYSMAKLKPLCTSSPLALKTYENRKLKSNYRMELNQQSPKKTKRDYGIDPEKRIILKTKSENKSPLTKNTRIGDRLGWFEEEDITMSDI